MLERICIAICIANHRAPSGKVGCRQDDSTAALYKLIAS